MRIKQWLLLMLSSELKWMETPWSLLGIKLWIRTMSRRCITAVWDSQPHLVKIMSLNWAQHQDLIIYLKQKGSLFNNYQQVKKERMQMMRGLTRLSGMSSITYIVTVKTLSLMISKSMLQCLPYTSHKTNKLNLLSTQDIMQSRT